MNSLPIVIREMRVTARKPWIYRMRAGVALVSVAVWVFVFLLPSAGGSAAAKGMGLLISLSVIAMLLALVSGVFLTADCISAEKRGGTIGLLFLTPLKGRDVVFGKLAANGAVAFFAFLAIWPVLSLPLLTGGVSWAEVWRIILVLLLALAFSLSLGLFVSMCHTDSRKAFAMSLLVMIAVSGLPLAAWFLMEIGYRRSMPDHLFFQLSPIYPLIFAFDQNYGRFTGSLYWRSLGWLAVASVLLLGISCWRLRFCWQDTGKTACQSSPAGARESQPRAKALSSALARHRSGRGADLYAWLCCRGAAVGSATHGFLVLAILFWFLMLVLSGTSQVRQQGFMLAMLSAFVLHLTVKSLLASEATRQIHQDVRGGTMELLLATPLQEREIILGHALACRRTFQSHLVLLSLINVIMEMAVFVFYDHLNMRDVAATFTVFFVGGIVLLHADARAIRWVGIWQALRARTHLRATFETLKTVQGLPWILFPVLFFMAVQQRGRRSEQVLFVLMLCWFALSLCFDLYLIGKTKRRLPRQFRELAGSIPD